MKYFLSLCALVLAGSLPGFAGSAHPTGVHPQFQNQFHFTPSGPRALEPAAREESATQGFIPSQSQTPASRLQPSQTGSHSAFPRNVRRHTPNPPAGKTGFLAATQIPAGGQSEWPVLSGDFNGDGNPDLVSEIYGYDSNISAYTFAVSVVLSNGDGTFQTPVLTDITDKCAALFPVDLNRDGKTDLIVGHEPKVCGNSNTQPTFEVWLSNGNGLFTPAANVNNTIPTSALAGGTLADTNGDGKLDIVFVDAGSPANVFTLLGNGDGTFQAPTSVALSGQVGRDTIVADLNGDGLLDIADNDYTTNQLTVYLAGPGNTYGAASTYQTADNNYYACTLAVGDLNGDGYPELVNTNNCKQRVGNDITVYVNQKNGTFATGAYYNSAMSGGTNSADDYVDAAAVSIADVNGDGNPDLVAVNYHSADVTILLGKGDGTFSLPTIGYAYGGGRNMNLNPHFPPIVADFNGDGFADIVVPDNRFSFVYLRGYGDGTFRSALNYYAGVNGYAQSYGGAVADLNGDGHPDVVIPNYCVSCTAPIGITVFLSNPDGSLQSGMNFGSEDFYFVAVADLNGDKKLDIAAVDYTTGTVTIFYGDGTGNFPTSSTFNTDLASSHPYGITVGDFNNDGFPDLAIANWNNHNVAILLNDQAGNFPTPMPTVLTGRPVEGMVAADLGNGTMDLIVPYWNGSNVAVLVGNGDGTFQPEWDLAVTEPVYATLNDFNGDGKLDMAVTSNQGGGHDIFIALGNGDGTFQTPTAFASSVQDNTLYSSPIPNYLQIADIDGDGTPDLVYSNTNYGTVGVMFGMGGGSFFDPVEYPAGGYDWSASVADANGDGAPDAFTSNARSATVSVLLNNNGTGTLGAYTIQATGAQTVSAGGAAKYTLTITPLKHYNGTVTLSCPTGLPALTSCSFSPSAVVTLDGLTPQTVTLTITTTAPSASSMRLHSSVEPQSNARPRSSAMMLASLNGIGVFGMFLAGNFNKKRIRSSMIALLALGLLLFLVGCGGSSNTTTTPPPTKSNSTSSVTSSAATVLVGQQVTFTGTVSGTSGTPTGTVTFLDGSTTLGTGTLSSGSATFQTTSLAAGVHSITISYGGDSNFNTSTSSAFSQTVDKAGTPAGTYAVTVTGAGTAGTNGVASPSQSISVNITVQ